MNADLKKRLSTTSQVPYPIGSGFEVTLPPQDTKVASIPPDGGAVETEDGSIRPSQANINAQSQQDLDASKPGLSSPPPVWACPPVLCARVITRSERNLVRLRLWLGSKLFKSMNSSGVYRFGPHSVLKCTGATRMAEAANMEYIRCHTSIPVPRVHDVFMIEHRTFIVMDYINGTELSYCRRSLSEGQKDGIFAQLKEYITQMRTLAPPHPGRVECADGSGVFDIRLSDRPFESFPTIKEFHARLGHDVILDSPKHREVWPHFEIVAKRNYHTSFTHADIASRNILVKNGKIAAVIDWETAGWYPEYWEYTRWADSNYRSIQALYDLRDIILDPYPDELIADEYIGSVFTRL